MEATVTAAEVTGAMVTVL
jgi:hypothetical protein